MAFSNMITSELFKIKTNPIFLAPTALGSILLPPTVTKRNSPFGGWTMEILLREEIVVAASEGDGSAARLYRECVTIGLLPVSISHCMACGGGIPEGGGTTKSNEAFCKGENGVFTQEESKFSLDVVPQQPLG
ncbi:hypothetical protein HPP92_025967 [Vanilla planifolia]|uniref:Uncharacterized protein n=1 Tax=Vanilla planifolia TaxID=51239 RepID=A0A835PDW3_VANPL|nr:hypothetical protein HPP92_026237 [Vanilla planifolia]KAG0451956.1 hypothetical protein HPP92_025967 [Vanilla planifolia]